jgi:tetracycline 7-halogenase / FADH2 O2-dependent halogenase
MKEKIMQSYDVTVIGTGMAGSIAALLLAKLGYKTLMVEKDTHPRFALGESSTPVFSKKIRQLGETYGIPELIDISSYNRIMESKDPFLCGPKELFQYFIHDEGQTEAKVDGRYREISVQTPDVDSQFMRAVLDQRLVEYAKKYGSDYLEKTNVLDIEFCDERASMHVQTGDGAPYYIDSKFVIDATGFRSLMTRKFDLRIPDAELDTTLRSRCIFTHFETVGTLEDAVVPDPEFNKRITVDRLRATQHHCFDGGWYWFIPFDNGVTSVGVNLDMDKYPMNDKPAEEEFWEITKRLPIVHKMLEGRKSILPWAKSGRLQFRTRHAAGDRWALLPAAAQGVDAWFSTGMGMNLISIHRLVETLHEKVLPRNDFRKEHFKHYETAMFREWHYITRMVDGMYKSFNNYDVFKFYCFLCFMGAESHIYSGGIKKTNDPTALMLNVGNPAFVANFDRAYATVLECHRKGYITPEQIEAFQAQLQHDMKAFNFRDYGNPDYDGVHYRVARQPEPERLLKQA